MNTPIKRVENKVNSILKEIKDLDNVINTADIDDKQLQKIKTTVILAIDDLKLKNTEFKIS